MTTKPGLVPGFVLCGEPMRQYASTPPPPAVSCATAGHPMDCVQGRGRLDFLHSQSAADIAFLPHGFHCMGYR